ncbi:MAG TPA: N-acetylglucosamine-6-phosphate deacetylase [Aldersonia sp.]
MIAAGTVVVGSVGCGVAHSPGWIETTGDRIVDCGAGVAPRAPDVDLPDAVVVPGFVDMHCHGGGGHAYTDADPESAAAAARFHLAQGTTSTVASLVTATPADLLRSVCVLADLVADGVVAGIHLEGPWLSHSRCGAHAVEQLRDPDPTEIDALLRAGRGTIAMATLAPELPGGLDAIRRLVDAGVVAAVGHTDATYAQAREAVQAGASVATHLFNAMRPLHHREPGAALALLECPEVTVEVVADGVHIHPALQRHVLASAGARRVAGVTDAMAAAGAPDGSYTLGTLAVTVEDGVAKLAGTDTIAGSTATMDRIFRNMVATSELPRELALSVAAETTATAPARALGLTDVGALRPGLRADLVVLDSDLTITSVMSRGRWLREPVQRVSSAIAST